MADDFAAIDLADAQTPVAHSPADVVRLAGNAPSLDRLTARISVCRACPRLVDWREAVAVEKRASFRGEVYWGRPVTGWGANRPRVLVLGLAPAAHGGNRTGRIFTGDRSGDWLFSALHRAGFATLPTSVSASDGQRLIDMRMIAAVRCAPPANKPTVVERDTCSPWLVSEIAAVMSSVRVVVSLGSFAWQAAWSALADLGYAADGRRPTFGHLAEGVAIGPTGQVLMVASYHPSQQNTFTGKLTEPMLDSVFDRIKRWLVS